MRRSTWQLHSALPPFSTLPNKLGAAMLLDTEGHQDRCVNMQALEKKSVQSEA